MKNSDNINPWPGLASYSEEEQELFYGRKQESEELFRQVKREALTTVFGASGVGKSSLINAGLLPRLRNENFLPIRLRIDYSGSHSPHLQIQDTITATASNQDVEIEEISKAMLSAEQESLWEQFHRLEFWDKHNKPITPVLIFDQFEEIFTLGRNSEDAAILITQLADLIENHIPEVLRRCIEKESIRLNFPYQSQNYKVVLVIREDFAARFDQLCKQIPSGMHNRFHLEQMNGEQALAAVINPGKEIISNKTAEDIVRFTAASGDNKSKLTKLEVEPALLSVVCRELNLRRQQNRAAKISGDLLSGSREAILEDFYERSSKDLAPEVRIMIEDELLTSSGFRDSLAVEDAHKIYKIQEETLIKLENRRLLRREERQGVARIELVHDLLTGVILKSRDIRRENERKKKLTIAFSVVTFVLVVVSLLSFFSYRNYLLAEEQRGKAEEQTHIAIKAQKVAQEQTAIAELEKEKTTEQLVEAEHNLGLALLTKANTALAEKDFNGAHLYALYALAELKPASKETVTAKWLAQFNPVFPIRFRTPKNDRHGSFGREITFSPDRKMVAVSYGYQEDIIVFDIKSGAEKFRLQGNKKSVNCISFSLDGNTLASGSDNIITVWNLLTKRVKFKLTSHEGPIRSVAFSQDGNTLASGSKDTTIIIWDLLTKKEKLKLTGHENAISSVTFSQDGNTLASGSVDTTIIIWDLLTKKEKFQLPGHNGSITGMAFSQNGDTLASAGGNSCIIWDLPNKREKFKFYSDEGAISSIAFSPDGKTLAAGAQADAVILWDLLSKKEKFKLRGHKGSVQNAVFSPDGNTLISVSDNTSIISWNLLTQKRETELSLRSPKGHGNDVTSIAFSPDGNTIASTSKDTIIIWDIAKGEQKIKLQDLGAISSNISFSPDGQTLAFGTSRNTKSHKHSIIIWDLLTNTKKFKLQGHERNIDSVVFSPSGNTLVAHSHRDVILWDIAAEKEMFSRRFPETILSIDFSPDGHFLAIGSKDRSIRILDIANRSIKTTLYNHTASVEKVAFSPDGTVLASGSVDDTVRIWDLATGEEKITIKLHSNRTKYNSIYSMVFAPDSKSLALGAEGDNMVTIWDLQSKTKKIQLFGHTNNVLTIAFSPDGKTLASGSKDDTMIVWDLSKDGEKSIHWEKHSAEYSFNMAFSPDGKILAVASGRYSIKIFDPVSGQELFLLEGDPGNSKFGSINSIAFSPDSKILISGSSNGDVIIWNISTGKEISRIKHTVSIQSVVFSPNGAMMSFGGSHYGVYAVTLNKKIGSISENEQLFQRKLHALNLIPLLGSNKQEYLNKIFPAQTSYWPPTNPFHWIKAAENGDVESMVQLGITYERRDENNKAVFWYTKAMQAGSTSGQDRLIFLTTWLKKKENQKNGYNFNGVQW